METDLRYLSDRVNQNIRVTDQLKLILVGEDGRHGLVALLNRVVSGLIIFGITTLFLFFMNTLAIILALLAILR